MHHNGRKAWFSHGQFRHCNNVGVLFAPHEERPSAATMKRHLHMLLSTLFFIYSSQARVVCEYGWLYRRCLESVGLLRRRSHFQYGCLKMMTYVIVKSEGLLNRKLRDGFCRKTGRLKADARSPACPAGSGAGSDSAYLRTGGSNREDGCGEPESAGRRTKTQCASAM